MKSKNPALFRTKSSSNTSFTQHQEEEEEETEEEIPKRKKLSSSKLKQTPFRTQRWGMIDEDEEEEEEEDEEENNNFNIKRSSKPTSKLSPQTRNAVPPPSSPTPSSPPKQMDWPGVAKLAAQPLAIPPSTPLPPSIIDFIVQILLDTDCPLTPENARIINAPSPSTAPRPPSSSSTPSPKQTAQTPASTTIPQFKQLHPKLKREMRKLLLQNLPHFITIFPESRLQSEVIPSLVCFTLHYLAYFCYNLLVSFIRCMALLIWILQYYFKQSVSSA